MASRGKREVTSKSPLEPQRVKLPLPIGVAEYKDVVSNYYYVDKTLFIRDFLDRIPKVTLFTRPRRFGKTLNMDMLKTFFEYSEEDTSIYFQDKAIWQCGEAYTRHQGKYPVVFLSFKDCKYDTWEETFQSIMRLLRDEYARHSELGNSSAVRPADQVYYQSVLSETLSPSELTRSLLVLSKIWLMGL